MHNSLYIRDFLKRTKNSPIYKERKNPHRSISFDPESNLQPGDFKLSGDWNVCHDGKPCSKEAAKDLKNFLSCMNISVKENTEKSIFLSTKDNLLFRSFNLIFSPEEIQVQGSDAAGLWAGVAWMEWEMKIRRGPFLPNKKIMRNALWQVQISQGPWGENYSVPDFSEEYLSDDSFRLYAHYGVNSMMIYGDLLCYVKSKIFPELNCSDYEKNIEMLKNAAKRALKYGVRFSYVVVGPKLKSDHPLFQKHPAAKGTGEKSRLADYNIHCLCSSNEECLDFYSETFENLFINVPEIAGLILIIGGESFYHCRIWNNYSVKCKRCYAKSTEDVVINLANVIDKSVKKVQPNAWVAVWPYSTGGWERPDCINLIKKLPAGITFFDQIDKNHNYKKNGYIKKIWDYSIDFIGPSDTISAWAKAVKEKGNRLFLKTETAIGLEVFQYPYVPCMQQLSDKWQVVRRLNPYGVHQSWLFFGMFGSRAEELGLWASYGKEIPENEFLHSIAVMDFGAKLSQKVVSSWQKMSEAVKHIPCICLYSYYIGPSFLGPAHPLIPCRNTRIPDVFSAQLFYLQEGEETFSKARYKKVETCLVMSFLPGTARKVHIEWEGSGDGWNIISDEYSVAADKAKQSWQILLKGKGLTNTLSDKRNLEEETLLAELIYRTFETCKNTVDFLYARKKFEKTDNQKFLCRMKKIAEVEMENSEGSIHIYDEAPWLDIKYRTDGIFNSCKTMINTKIVMIKSFMSSDTVCQSKEY